MQSAKTCPVEIKTTRATSIKTEIERRTRDTAKLIEIETKKLAVGELVLERLDAILELLEAAGIKVNKTVPRQAQLPPMIGAQGAPSLPPNTVVMQASQLPSEQPAAPVKNPCSICGQEAAFDEPMPDGTRKFYCRPHGQARMKEKAEDQQTAALMGSTGTMFARAQKPNAPPAQKVIIQADQPDMLKGPFPNGGGPPSNNVLDD
jgi:hypothetical protein